MCNADEDVILDVEEFKAADGGCCLGGVVAPWLSIREEERGGAGLSMAQGDGRNTPG